MFLCLWEQDVKTQQLQHWCGGRMGKKKMEHCLLPTLLTEFYNENVHKVRHIYYNLRTWKKSYNLAYAPLPRTWLMMSAWLWALSTDLESSVDCNALSSFTPRAPLCTGLNTQWYPPFFSNVEGKWNVQIRRTGLINLKPWNQRWELWGILRVICLIWSGCITNKLFICESKGQKLRNRGKTILSFKGISVCTCARTHARTHIHTFYF